MSRRPLFDRPMTAVERQQRRRLKLAGGPAPRLKREVQRALDAGLPPAELAQTIAPILGGVPVPADPTSPVLGHERRDVPVTKEPEPQESPEPSPPTLAEARAAYIAAIEREWPMPEVTHRKGFSGRALTPEARAGYIVRAAELLDVLDAMGGFDTQARQLSGRSFMLGEQAPERTLTAHEVASKLAEEAAQKRVTKPVTKRR